MEGLTPFTVTEIIMTRIGDKQKQYNNSTLQWL